MFGFTALKDKNEFLEAKNKALKDLIQAERNKSEAYALDHRVLRKVNKNLCNLVDTLRAEIHEAEEVNNKLRAELEATKDCLDKSATELDRVARERDALRAELALIATDRDHWKKVCAAMGDEIEGLRASLSDADSINFNLKTKMEGLKACYEHLASHGSTCLNCDHRDRDCHPLHRDEIRGCPAWKFRKG